VEQFVENFFRDHGLLALYVLMLLDNIGVPFPSEIPLLLAGVSVSQGDMNFGSAFIVAGIGSLTGALILYVLGRTVGRAVVIRWGRWIRVSEQDLDRAERWFHRRGESSVLFLRVVPLARTLISIPAGMFEMRPIRFGSYTIAGSVAWSMIVIGVGWALGDSYRAAVDEFGFASLAGAGMIGMALVIWIVKRLASRRAMDPQATPPAGAPAQPDPSRLDPPAPEA